VVEGEEEERRRIYEEEEVQEKEEEISFSTKSESYCVCFVKIDFLLWRYL
jgi:hypothetical protein